VRNFVAPLHLQMCECTDIFLVNMPQMPTSQFFLVDAPVGGGDSPPPHHPPAVKRVSMLSLNNRHAYKRQRQMNTPTNTSAAADVRAEREKARQEILAWCAAWRQGKTFPPLCESPPHASKTAAIACIVSQMHHPPLEEHPGYVPVASVVEESGHRGSICAASLAVGRA
jgi:hypothetical protein